MVNFPNKKIISAILILLLGMITSNVFAANWIETVKLADQIIYLDIDSIKKDDNTALYQISMLDVFSKVNAQGASMVGLLMQVNLGNRTFRGIKSVNFDSKGNVISQNTNSSQWGVIQPGTVMASTVELLIKKTQNTEQSNNQNNRPRNNGVIGESQFGIANPYVDFPANIKVPEAARWEWVGDAGESQFFIDINSIVAGPNGMREAWIKYIPRAGGVCDQVSLIFHNSCLVAIYSYERYFPDKAVCTIASQNRYDNGDMVQRGWVCDRVHPTSDSIAGKTWSRVFR